MTQEEKDLLLKDLCARLPYGVKILTPTNCWTSEEDTCELKEIFKGDDGLFRIGDIGALIEYSKPYLLPMSSMTEEQKNELNDTLIQLELKALNDEIEHHKVAEFEIDFYNKNMFDYRGLIEKGLANDATGLNIY